MQLSHRSIPLTFAAVAMMLPAACSDSPDDNGDPSSDSNLLTACIRSTACDVRPYPRVSNCVQNYLDRETPAGRAPVLDPIYRCINRAVDCRGIRDCVGAQGSCDTDFMASCDNDTAVFCDLIDKSIYIYSCESAGLRCQVDNINAFAATCVLEPGSPASAPALSTSADCRDGSCQFTGQACSADALNRCLGDKLQACLEGQWISFDCLKLGLKPCVSMPGGWGTCASPL
jgi:hypothetical protein